MNNLDEIKGWRDRVFCSEQKKMPTKTKIVHVLNCLIQEIEDCYEALFAMECDRDMYRQQLQSSRAEIDRLRGHIIDCLNDNGHLADGEVCTLISLKRAVPCMGVKEMSNRINGICNKIEKLEPCPFCGGTNINDKGFGVECRTCGVWIGDGSSAHNFGGYKALWNTRVHNSSTPQQKEATQ